MMLMGPEEEVGGDDTTEQGSEEEAGQTQSWWASDQQNGDFSITLRQIGLKFGGVVPCAELPHCAAALGAGKWHALAE